MRSNAAGFTLLEVLVAFALLAATLGGAYRAVSSGAAAGERATDRMEALSRAETTLARMATSPTLPPGRRMIRDGDWVVEVRITPLAPADGAAWRRLGRVPLTVSATAYRRGQTPATALTALVSRVTP